MSDDAPASMTAARADHARVDIDLSAITANAAAMKQRAGTADLMAIVKADGYGHGAGPVASAALAGGATSLGVATLGEAESLRAGGVDAPLLAWLWSPSEDVRPAIAAGVQIGISSRQHLEAVSAAAHLAPSGELAGAGTVPIHVKVDTGMGRNGVMPADLPDLAADIAAAQRAGTVRMVGIMSHFACADVADDPSIPAQIATFTEAVAAARAAGLTPRWRHLANTAATLALPQAHFDLVRCGIGLYGLSPLPEPSGLTPAMTLRTTVALTKRVPAGQGVGYGLTYHTSRETTLALVPVGYGDGILRIADGNTEVLVAGRRHRIAGRVSMDQIVIDCGDAPVSAGDDVIVFGPGTRGEPTADDWATWSKTISYEVITSVAPRIARHYSGEHPGDSL